jgi:soluble lytic murein transglycosylase-like protein
MSWIISLWLALQSTTAEAEALRSTAPAYLTPWSAGQHLGAARIAAASYDVDAAAILAIAYHESRFFVGTRTHEPPDSGGPRVSCGVMTPVPKRYCDAQDLTLLGGYQAGAAHLRQWMDVCHAMDRWKHDVHDVEILRCALWAYAGGSGFRKRCAARGNLPGCGAVRQFEERARVIRQVLGVAR